MSELDSDRLFVKKDNLARCAWCGTPESDSWVTTQKNEIFCSSECEEGKHASKRFNYGFYTACIGSIWLLGQTFMMLRFPSPPLSSSFVFEWMISAFLFFMSGIVMMIAGYEGNKYRNRKDMCTIMLLCYNASIVT